MRYHQNFFAICFFLTPFYQAKAQTSFEKDSIRLMELIDGMETYYQDPFRYRTNIPEAYLLINQMLIEKPNHTQLRKVRTRIADLYYAFKSREMNYEEGLKVLLKNVQEREELKDSCDLSRSYRNLAAFWRNQKDFTKASGFLDQSLEISLQCNNEEEQVKTLSAYGIFYQVKKDYFQAETYYRKALELSERTQYTGGKAHASWNLYRIYSLKKEYGKALSFLRTAEDGFDKTNNISSLERVNSSYGTYYRKNGNPKKAIGHFKKSIAFCQKLKDSSRLMYRYLGISNAYVQLKDFENAYYNYLNYKGIQKKIDNQKQYKRLVEIETKMAYENQKVMDSIQYVQQKLLDESEIKRQANTRFWLYVILLSAILITTLVFYLLSRHKLKEQAYQNILLSEKVASKTEEIQELLHETMRQIKSKEKIALNLQKYSREEKGISLQSILADLKASKVDDAKLVLIKENIEKVNFDFIKALKTTHPNLTKTEVEICSFIKMGLTR